LVEREKCKTKSAFWLEVLLEVRGGLVVRRSVDKLAEAAAARALWLGWRREFGFC
jgi:hypothetical protein